MIEFSVICIQVYVRLLTCEEIYRERIRRLVALCLFSPQAQLADSSNYWTTDSAPSSEDDDTDDAVLSIQL